MNPIFTTSYQELLSQIENIDPILYGKTRNYIDGAVTYVSPYISRGVISTRFILERMLHRGLKIQHMETFVKELAWRDFFQSVWNAKGNDIDNDLKNTQSNVAHHLLPSALIEATTGIEAIDSGIRELYATGYMHNHLRMYTASVATNCAQAHWLYPARWMYYYLLDADWASNALSWQWVAGAFSNKKYVANQENINRYMRTNQVRTFLDCDYDALPPPQIPTHLRVTQSPVFETLLPSHHIPQLQDGCTTALYTMYNLDPLWRSDEQYERVLLLEPSFFARYPVCERTLQFVCDWARTIPGMQIAVCEFAELQQANPTVQFVYKQHPTTSHFVGLCDEREWLAPDVRGYYPSFFAYWKQCEKELTRRYE